MKPANLFPLLGFCFAFSLPALAEDWPNWRGARLNGVSNETISKELPESLPVLWTADVGIGFSSFAVVGNRVLTMGNSNDKDTVWCLDAETGNMLWKHTYECELDPRYYEGGPGGTPTVHDGAVYTFSKKGHAFRLNLETGKVEWSRDLVNDHDLEPPEWDFAGSAFLQDDRVILNAGRGGIALSRDSGETLWLSNSETSGYATVVPFSPKSGDTQHLLFSAKSLLSIDIADGKIHWEFPWRSSRDVNAADPLIIENEIVISSTAGTKRLRPKTDGATPEVVWEQKDLKWYFNPGVLIDGHIYSLNGTTHRPTELNCTNVATGETIWSKGGFGSGGLIAAGKHVIVFDFGTLTIFPVGKNSFEPILQQKVLEGKCWTAPAVANGRIFCRNAEGKIAALKLP